MTANVAVAKGHYTWILVNIVACSVRLLQFACFSLLWLVVADWSVGS
jgi:hypothetical protein